MWAGIRVGSGAGFLETRKLPFGFHEQGTEFTEVKVLTVSHIPRSIDVTSV